MTVSRIPRNTFRTGQPVSYTHLRVLSVPNAPQTIFKLVGLDEDAEYEDVKSGRIYDGRELMNYGLSISFLARDFDTVTMLLKKKQPHA